MHSAMNQFISDLPPPAYPFDVNMDAAKRGEAISMQIALAVTKPITKSYTISEPIGTVYLTSKVKRARA